MKRLSQVKTPEALKKNESTVAGKTGGKMKRLSQVKTPDRLKKTKVNMRDAYVNMMLKIANSRCMSSGISDGNYKGFGMRQLKEYDEKVLVEIYKSMAMVQGQLVSRAGAGASAAEAGTEIMCQQ
ncbi:hypothetical protein K7X08_020330 [Anisodus acutangulus]|uniref:Uncharacterized protein n=1 Tax=Anisodus acutangulus TaxID=402998 RepID=A0A9Q1REF0_9SOLA|nr:hypothetical protein K7X08_020330 [Anisodus acutangulus]